VKKAVADIFAGKTFDYGTICSSEQAIVTEEAIREQVLEECRKQDAYFLSADEIARLGSLVFLGGAHVPNTQVVGRPATTIAEMAGIKVPSSTRVLIAKLDDIGRDVPLSAEKLSPILAFYSAPNLSAAIEICVRLLEHGGAGHTASIHSQSEAAVKQYGLAVPAFRIAVNTSSVHGSIGYSTNLFPAMTLGCGSPGGNITSDNIGPQHLMNVKRVAWESRPIEHRTIPADQRLVAMSVPVQKSAAASAGASGTPASSGFSALGFSGGSSFAPAAKGGDVDSDIGHGTALAVPKASTSPGALAPEAISLKATLSPIVAAAAALAPVPDRQTIARIVEQVFTARGIPRRGGSTVASLDVSQNTPAAAPKSDAEKMTSAPGALIPKPAPIPTAPPPTPHPLPPPVEVAEFLSENDVRMALTRNRKLYIGPKTILTPSARDLGNEHEIFIMTDIVPATKKRYSES
jgi:hypothetical protein